jgi:two-component system, OmpR family, heavy metal sensor histidine kinase CusS
MPFARLNDVQGLSGLQGLRRLSATLRFRLVAWMVVVTVVLVAVTMLAVHQVFSAAIQNEFDQTLKADVVGIGLEFKQHYPDWRRLSDTLDRRAFAHPIQAWFVEILDEDGKRVCYGGLLPTSSPHFERHKPPPRTFNFADYRLRDTQLDLPELPVHYVRVGGLVHTLNREQALLTQSMLWRGFVFMILVPLGGYVIALRATRPMAWINATAARLQPEKLDERLPIRGTGDELDLLSQTINHLLDRIASYIDRNREFVANAAHELRSPLAAIRSSVEVALSRERSPEEYDALLAEVMEECDHLSSLVKRLLLLAEGDAGRLAARGQTARLDKIVRESVEMFAGVAESQGVEIDVGELPAATVPGDEFYLRQVVRNLLDNAIKFSPPPGKVTVALSVDAAARSATLSVRDRGLGIPAADLPHVFERFYRGDKARQREPGRAGNGLGLSICQAIVQALHGNIAVDSKPGEGSTFTVRLPLVEETKSTRPALQTATV